MAKMGMDGLSGADYLVLGHFRHLLRDPGPTIRDDSLLLVLGMANG
jgi:hypothetical protein